MTGDFGQRSADTDPFGRVPAARPGDGGFDLAAQRLRPQLQTRPAGRASRVMPVVALPLADVLALAAAVGVVGRAAAPEAIYALAVFGVLAAMGLHRLRICLRVADQAGRIITAAALPLLALLLWIPADVAVRLALWSAGLVIAFRIAVCAVLRTARRAGLLGERAVVVGAGTFGAHIGELMRAHPELGLRVQGYLDYGPPRRDLALPSLGVPADLARVVTRLGIRRVIVCYAACKDEDLVAVLRAARPLRADICVVPRLYEVGMAVPRACLDEIWGIPLIPLRPPPRAGLAVKRATDIAVGLIGGLLAAPLVLMLAAVIRISSGTPALFRQTRVTGKETVTTIMKLRTLPVPRDQDAPGADTQWRADEERCGPFSRWLRATHLDELPQLVNVLRGEMSLVGPRPERPQFAQRFCRDIPRYADRTRMPGGLTGWAQVNGLNGDTSVFDRARFDNYYAEYWSPWLDAVILMRTAVQVGHAALGRT